MNRAFYHQQLQRDALEKALLSGEDFSFNLPDELELLGLYCKLTGLYLLPNKDTADRARRRYIVEAEARRIADDTNAPLSEVRVLLLQLMSDFV